MKALVNDGRENTKQAIMLYFHCGPFIADALKLKRQRTLHSADCYSQTNSLFYDAKIINPT